MRDAFKSRCLRSACAFALMAVGAAMPVAYLDAEDDVYRIASVNTETAGTVAEYNFDRNDFIEAKDAFIGVFDLFGDDEINVEDESETTGDAVKPDKKPDDVEMHHQYELPLEEPAHQVTEYYEPREIETPPYPKARPNLYGEGILSSGQAKIYKKIFALQAAGRMKEADKEIAKLNDHRLRGHYLYQRYMHPTAYTTTFDELRNWLILYSDLPGAKSVYRLALKKQPSGFDGYLPAPSEASQIVRKREPNMYYGATYESPRARSYAQRQAVQTIENNIRNLVKRDRFTVALQQLNAVAGQLDHVEYDNIRAYIAEGYLHNGHLQQAYQLASASAKRSADYAPLAGWVAGLVSWTNGDYEAAANYFALTARSRFASSWTQSGGAFWAARASMRAGNPSQARGWLTEATKHPRTFYGLISTRAMGRSLNFNWSIPTFTSKHSKMLLETNEGRRAADLVAAGQFHMAEAELLRLNPQTQDMQEALLAYASHEGLPALALRAGTAFEGRDGYHYDAALYPTGKWKARGDFDIDADLVHAIMRQESKFDARAESHSGALGLMQIMPTTASFIARDHHMKSRTGQEQLLEPDTNIELGQKYLNYLLNYKYVDGDITSMLIAYNAGPGNLRRWKQKWANVQDPLLFMELIPARETRGYVERVLSNFWMYRARNGLSTPTLDAMAKGRQALYADALRATGGSGLYKVAQTP